jgi:hypothetical protein
MTGMPRWVKVFLIVGAALLLLMVAVLLLSGGEHGPGRHLSFLDQPGSVLPEGTTPSGLR